MWKKKKFWKSIRLNQKESEFGILLDNNLLKTPKKKDCTISNKIIAEYLFKEWSSIEDEINFNNMPFTQICFASLDREKKEQIVLHKKLIEYGMTDLLFYRDDLGTELEKLQSKKWDKLLNWIENEFNLQFNIVNGLMPVKQPSKNYNIFLKELKKLDSFSLTAINEIVTLSGSLILGMLLLKKKILPNQAWSLSKVDEDWQRSNWGTIPEQLEDDENKKKYFFISCKFVSNLN
ncbi:MAG: ATP12 family protein [Paracoccaceae bacterium]